MLAQSPNCVLKSCRLTLRCSECTAGYVLAPHLLTLVNSCRQDRPLWPKSGPTRSCCNTSWRHNRSDCWWPIPAARRRHKYNCVCSHPWNNDRMVQTMVGYLGIVSTNWAGAFEGAIRVTLLRVWEGEIFHLVVPGLHVEGGGAIPGSKRNSHHLPFKGTLVGGKVLNTVQTYQRNQKKEYKEKNLNNQIHGGGNTSIALK